MQSLNSFLFGEETCFTIHGFSTCPYYERAVKLGKIIENNHNNVKIQIKQVDREQWKEYCENEIKDLSGQKARYHQTCPLIVEGCSDDAKSFVGGFSDFLILSRKKKLVKPNEKP